jgi:hypothetical protein
MISGHRPGRLHIDSSSDRRSCGFLDAELRTRGVSLVRGSLWIVPDLWKTPRTRFPQGRWKTAQHAVFHTLHRRTRLFNEQKKERP